MRRFCFLLIVLASCGPRESTEYVPRKDALFTRLPTDSTGISFENTLSIKEDFDVFRYRNFYNGGGVAIGDINNDGLADIYLTSNMGENKLFLNKGSWYFEDITTNAGVAGTKFWSTGVSMADVNGDGLMDIYVCNAGDIVGDNRENELFINNGDLTFTERAAEYGLADKGYSTHAAFLDYDHDGDLDCYILNNSYRQISTLGYRNLRHERDALGGHKLYRNDDGHFIDVSEKAGIYGSVIGFGLGVTVGDVNQDNWPDLYISNDFYERDYLYINNRDGTFSEKLEESMGHISMFSMGGDIADLNNDGYPEIFSTDMLPSDDSRLKTLTAFETYDVYQLRLQNGYYHQFMRNMLQLNNGDGTFTEIGQLAGVNATDWSWGALIADFNNDTHKEIFVGNGIYRDVTNQDFVEFLGSSDQMRAAIEGKAVDYKKFVNEMPSQKLSNAMFARTGEWKYKNVSAEWGLDEPGFSNGSAYGDLDNDGDLDLVVNNVNMELFVYRNNTREKLKNHFVAIRFKGYARNSFGLGAEVKAFFGGQEIAMENMPIRGFQSSMDYKMVIGLGTSEKVDSLNVAWPDGKSQTLRDVVADKEILLDYENAAFHRVRKVIMPAPLLTEVSVEPIVHRENQYNDFDRDRLAYHMLSTQGPAFAQADLNNDGLDDFYLGGSMGSTGAVYTQGANNTFTRNDLSFLPDSLADETDAMFFDMDGDKDLDLYVVTGGSETNLEPAALQDRLYENTGTKDGAPVFVKRESSIPAVNQSGSCVRPADVDNDGDLDLLIGNRLTPGYYGLSCDQLLLINDGKGNFQDKTESWAPQFARLGMVTDASWFDYDGNGFIDLILTGEWMPVTIFTNDGKKLTRADNVKGLEKSDGWWNRIAAADIDHDGDIDFVLGNHGLNSKFQPTPESPITLYVNDFDQNGSMEPIFTFMKGEEEIPMAMRHDIIKQMSPMKKQFVYYRDYAGKTLHDIFDKDLLEKAEVKRFYAPATSVLINNGAAGFSLRSLPVQAQVAPVYGITIADVNNDSHPDILLGGNLFSVKPEVGRYDGLHGLLLLGDGKGEFTPSNRQQSGLKVEGQTRHIGLLRNRGKGIYVFIRNNAAAKFYTVKK